MKEYKDLKIMEVLSGYFIFKELLDNNLITKQDSGYTINVNEANVYLENQLLDMQQELSLKDDDIHTLSNDFKNARKIIEEYKKENESNKSKLDKIKSKIDDYSCIFNKGFPYNMLLAIKGNHPSEDQYLELDTVLKDFENII